jgi:hypothetical protein
MSGIFEEASYNASISGLPLNTACAAEVGAIIEIEVSGKAALRCLIDGV